MWEWFLGKVVEILGWWWRKRFLEWCHGLAGGWFCGVRIKGGLF